jgi:hypothetical protein
MKQFQFGCARHRSRSGRRGRPWRRRPHLRRVQRPGGGHGVDGRGGRRPAITLAHDLETNDRVHHVNCFVQPETVRAICSSLEIRGA